jgi:cyclopropane fatty-acyl-phospholipid synthase-like methyltransferase
MFRSNRISCFASALALATSGVSCPLAAQLGSRPAAEWAITLENGDRLERLEVEEVVAAIGLQPGEIVADIGAGTGIFSVPMARLVGANGTVLAVEIDAGFLPIIEGKAREQGVENVRTVLGEFGDPKLPRRDIDVAFFHDVLHHIQEREAYIRALGAYMPAGSRIVVVDYDMSVPGVPHSNQPEMLISPSQVAGWMAAAGFEPTREVEMFDDRFFVVYTKR